MDLSRRRSSSATKPFKRRSVLLLQSWWEDRVLRGVADYARQHNWELQCRMHWTHQPPKPGEWHGDGIIVFVGISRVMRENSRPIIRFVRGAGVPVVETQPHGNYFNAPKVIVPHKAVGQMAAEHFLGLNFHHCGYVTFDENPLEKSRRLGFQQTVDRAGREFHALTPQSLVRDIGRLPRSMALLAVNDPNALEVVRICRDAGFSVPEDFAVMGIDDTEIICDLAAVPLSSIDCNFERQGYEAAALLDRLMDGQPPPTDPIVVPPKGVTVRRSTDTVAMPDADAARMLRFMRDHYREKQTIQQAAAAADVSLKRTNILFRRHVGRSMFQELTRLRLEHAKALMGDPKLKLESIALESGFSNRFHFAQAFQRAIGKPPRVYRQQVRLRNPQGGGV
jgi:LacI family transcriptional regulator